MSKKLEALLKSLGVTNIEETITALSTEDDNQDAIQNVLKQAQAYARPFLETEYNEKMKVERGQSKGKYLKEALLKNNKIFGTPLTNKEIEDVLNDPENEGQTYDKAMELLREKIVEKKGGSEADLQKMLDTANAKINEYEATIPQLETKYKSEAEKTIAQFKLDGVVSTKLMQVLDGKTSMPAAKAAELIRGQISNRAALKLKEDGNIGLYKLGTEDEHLKKNDTTLYSFEALVDDIVTEYDLAKKSGGTERKKAEGGGGNEPNPDPKKPASFGLAAALEKTAAGA
jgi:hypothetical protein